MSATIALWELSAPPVITGRERAHAWWADNRASVSEPLRQAGDLIVEAEALYETGDLTAAAATYEVARDACIEAGEPKLAEECRHSAWFIDPEQIPDHSRIQQYRRRPTPQSSDGER